MNTPDVHSKLNQLQKKSLIIGVIGSALSILGAVLNQEQFFQSYLLSFLFWTGIALGCLPILMLHHLVGGAWGSVIRRLLEAGIRTLPLMAILFVPLIFGLHDLYIWAQPEIVKHDPLLQYKSAYLNVNFFIIRTAVYFTFWIGIGFLLNRLSSVQDRQADPSLNLRFQKLSGPGLILTVFSVTFASMDWAMSLDPHWYSTIYGLLFFVGQVLSTLAFVTIVLMILSDEKPLSEIVTPSHFHDLGNLTLAFVMLWAYMSLSQFLIIWSGNLAEEVPWYIHRSQGGWQWIALMLVFFHFMLPFFLLLSRRAKRQSRSLSCIAFIIIFMRFIDLFWLIVPSFHESGLHIHWLDIIVPIGMGGVWITVFIGCLKARPLFPKHDPFFQQAVAHNAR